MANVLLVAYLLIVLALIAVILVQRSEGGGLGMGGGNSGFMTVRSSANLLTRATAVLATLFMVTAIALTVMSEIDRGSQAILDRAADGIGTGGAGGGGTVLDALNQLQSQSTGEPVRPSAPAADPGLAVPQAPAAPAADPGLPAPAAPAGN